MRLSRLLQEINGRTCMAEHKNNKPYFRWIGISPAWLLLFCRKSQWMQLLRTKPSLGNATIYPFMTRTSQKKVEVVFPPKTTRIQLFLQSMGTKL